MQLSTTRSLQFTLCVAVASTSAALAKRSPPPTAEATRDGVTYVARYQRELRASPPHFSAHVEAREATTGRPRGTAFLYRLSYDPGLEKDVQEVFVLKLIPEEAGLIAVREDLRSFLLRPGAAAAVPLPAPSPPLARERLDRGPLILVPRGAPARCALHQVDMKLDVVAIAYGLPSFQPELAKARKARFPNAAADYPAGCVVGSWRWAQVRFCPRCRAERDLYLRTGRS